MATTRSEKENELLTATVCTEEYSDPCMLKCQHTFCQKCMTQYTNTWPEAVRSKTVPRLCCRQDIQVPNPTQPVAVIRHREDIIKQKERELMDKLDDITEKQISQLKADVKTEEIEIQMYRQHWEFIDQTLKTESVMDMYDMYQACLSGAIVFGEDGNKVTTDGQTIEEVRIIHDTDKLQSALADLSLGQTDVTYQDASEVLSSPVLNNTINMETENDITNPDAIDMTLLLVDGVQTAVVTDYGNKCVKSLFTQSKKPCIDKLQLGEGPWGITHLKEREVMVAVPNSYKIVAIEVSPKLKLTSTINTGKQYFGLSVLNQASLAAAAWNPDCSVDILNMTGQVMTSVKVSYPPWLICANNKSNLLAIYFHPTLESVTCLTPEGNEIWTHSGGNLTDPRGITTTSTGFVLVADYKSKKVIQLTESGEFTRAVLTSNNGLETPNCIYYDENGFLFVCDGSNVKQFRFI